MPEPIPAACVCGLHRGECPAHGRRPLPLGTQPWQHEAPAGGRCEDCGEDWPCAPAKQRCEVADAPCRWNEWLRAMTLAGALWDDEPCCEEHRIAHWPDNDESAKASEQGESRG